ncbi:MAG: hypothetical protein P4L57_01385 [Rhizomicrobium sp.]|nr:hypothetical protein [Rhizomicrobium sp.]
MVLALPSVNLVFVGFSGGSAQGPQRRICGCKNNPLAFGDRAKARTDFVRAHSAIALGNLTLRMRTSIKCDDYVFYDCIRILYAFTWNCMSSQPRMIFPELSSAAEFNETAVSKGWPLLCDESCSFDHAMLPELLALWRNEAADGIPARNALTARKLQPFMRNIALYERNGSGEQRRYRVRLMGSGIVQYYGELTGKFFDEAVPAKFLDRWYAFSDVALKAQKPLRVVLRADTFEKSYMTAEYLCAPLKDDAGLVKFVLVGMVFDGKLPWTAVEAETRQKLGLPPLS